MFQIKYKIDNIVTFFLFFEQKNDKSNISQYYVNNVSFNWKLILISNKESR